MNCRLSASSASASRSSTPSGTTATRQEVTARSVAVRLPTRPGWRTQISPSTVASRGWTCRNCSTGSLAAVNATVGPNRQWSSLAATR